jgi:hypothetical protein
MTETLSIPTTCPQDIARMGRQARNRKRERDPKVRALVKAWCKEKLCSCGCGKKADTAHHPTDDLYASNYQYLKLDECEPYYHHCHFVRHRGFERCPECHGWMKAGSEKCAKCRGWRYKNRKHLKHPCFKNVGQQRCTQKIVCPFSPRKAPMDPPAGCRAFEARAKA